MVNLNTMGNSRAALFFWSVIGLLCSLVFPVTTVSPSAGNGVLAAAMAGAAVVTLVLYPVGFVYLRRSSFMRVRRGGCTIAITANIFVSIVAVSVAVLHHVSARAIGAQILLVVWLFCFFELCRPTSDYGFLQFFLRLPVQCAISATYTGVIHMGGVIISFTVFVYLFCTCWSIFYLGRYERALVEAAAALARRGRDLEDGVQVAAPADAGLGLGDADAPPNVRD